MCHRSIELSMPTPFKILEFTSRWALLGCPAKGEMIYMHKLFFASLLIVCFVPLSVAQSSDPSRFELFGGYSVMRIDYEPDPIDPHTQTPIILPFSPKQTLHGFNASATVNLTGGFGLTGDFSGHFKTNSVADVLGGRITTHIRVFNVLGGPQYRFLRNSRVSPFVRGLAGVAVTHSTLDVPSINARDDFSSTDFALALGGGVDVRVSERVAVRVFQVDYNPIFLDKSNTLAFPKLRADNVRFSFGVVFR
jgi:opacity protein-like surface antigen